MHDFLTGRTFEGNYDVPPHGVLVLDERRAEKPPEQPASNGEAAPEAVPA